ncbi:transglutaminase domain-containing protein [Paenibacillus aquistagni]|uniref:Transglutaminase-like superfamily protein n=1 Tax=Paenibacillus aquistagni TaxID=1852522 RepID=A0A1X7KE39_9BACL|nr:transglutaminase domain-containing protein [Paenibacillus aquistagni]NMM53477.1 transglutaminase [Paenibacillus aquistagni]SMG38712.1 Transglutaminase-like superfamily protein [Paenibacillus aquistagni]
MKHVNQPEPYPVSRPRFRSPLSRRKTMRMNRKRVRGLMMRWMLAVAICSVAMTQAVHWSTAEAESSKQTFQNQDRMRQYVTEQMAKRESMFTFQYEGNTAALTKLLGEVMDQSLRSDPFIRYNVSRYSFHWKGTETAALITVYVNYRETLEQSQFVRNEAKRIVKAIIHDQQSDYEKIKRLHDYVVTHVSYDESMKHLTAYEALTVKQTVCQGYALLLQALLEEAGIPSMIVEGEAGGTLHAWNMVKLEGNWYHVDATWDDPVPDKKDQVRYTYFLLSDKEMAEDHTWDELKAPIADHVYLSTHQ